MTQIPEVCVCVCMCVLVSLCPGCRQRVSNRDVTSCTCRPTGEATLHSISHRSCLQCGLRCSNSLWEGLVDCAPAHKWNPHVVYVTGLLAAFVSKVLNQNQAFFFFFGRPDPSQSHTPITTTLFGIMAVGKVLSFPVQEKEYLLFNSVCLSLHTHASPLPVRFSVVDVLMEQPRDDGETGEPNQAHHSLLTRTK